MNTADIGQLPSGPPPGGGETISFQVSGRPPYKSVSRSIRNPGSSQRSSFLALRHEAIRAMAGRKWYEGPIGVGLIYSAPSLGRPLIDYLGGVMDTIGGSHGPSFIYLPVVFLDDSQAILVFSSFLEATSEHYSVVVEFLEPDPHLSVSSALSEWLRRGLVDAT